MSIQIKDFGKTTAGQPVKVGILANDTIEVHILSYGATIQQLLVPDRKGNKVDVVLGYPTVQDYELNTCFLGAVVGRYANRIGGAEFTLNGKTYTLAKNDGNNTLHGGPGGYHQVLWDAQAQDGDEPSITFTHTSPDGDEGYPGTLQMTVTYTLKKDNTLALRYDAVCDQETPFNPTNHSFFNLSGDPQKDVLGTYLTINSKASTAVSDDLIPTGEIVSIVGGPLDFTSPKKLGDDMFAEDHLIQLNGGFDHNFCVEGEGFRKHAEAYEPESGRVMEVWSDLPGVQLFTFNKPDDGLVGKDGKPMQPHTALCLETQFYPDSVHHENFPFQYLQPGVPFSTTTEYLSLIHI